MGVNTVYRPWDANSRVHKSSLCCTTYCEVKRTTSISERAASFALSGFLVPFLYVILSGPVSSPILAVLSVVPGAQFCCVSSGTILNDQTAILSCVHGHQERHSVFSFFVPGLFLRPPKLKPACHSRTSSSPSVTLRPLYYFPRVSPFSNERGGNRPERSTTPIMEQTMATTLVNVILR